MMIQFKPSPRVIAAALTLALFPFANARPAAAQGLSDVERRIAEHLDAHAEEAVALFERIVNINSGTMNPAGNEAVADVLADELRKRGSDVRWSPLPVEMSRARHPVAERDGRRGRRIIPSAQRGTG